MVVIHSGVVNVVRRLRHRPHNKHIICLCLQNTSTFTFINLREKKILQINYTLSHSYRFLTNLCVKRAPGAANNTALP